MSKHLPLPDEQSRPRQDKQPNRANCVEDVRNTNSVHPSRHSEDKDSAEHIAQESEGGERVTDNVCTD